PSFGSGLETARTRSNGLTLLLIAIGASGWFHAMLFGGILVYSWMHKNDEPEKRLAPVEIVDLTKMPSLKVKLDEIRKIAALNEPKFTPPDMAKGQIVELPDDGASKEAPKNGKYLATANHTVAEEPVSKAQGMAPKV